MTKRVKQWLWWLLLAVVALAVAVGLFRWGYDTYLKAAYPLEYEDYVAASAAEYDLPPTLVYAVIHTESHFDPNAVSSAGAKGLMQLMDATYEWIQTQMTGETQPSERIYDPQVNIRCGCRVLDVLMSQFDNTETALAAYNAGSGNVSKWLKNPEYSDDGVTLKEIPVRETRNYVKRVLKAWERYQTIYEWETEE